jgi:hypothetical protein
MGKLNAKKITPLLPDFQSSRLPASQRGLVNYQPVNNFFT